MATLTVAFFVKDGVVLDLVLEGAVTDAGEALRELRANAALTTLTDQKLDALPVGKIIRFKLKPGVYWVTSENAVKYSIVEGAVEPQTRAGKDPWPDPPPPPPDKASYGAMNLAVWNPQFRQLVGPVAVTARQWVSFTPSFVKSTDQPTKTVESLSEP